MNKTPSPILIIGPDADQVGGMSSVVSQMRRMDFGGRFRPAFLPITLSASSCESSWQRLTRHRRQSRQLRHLIALNHTSVVHIHTCSGFSFVRSSADMLIAQRLGCRVALHIHGAAFHEFHDRQSEWRRRLIRWSLTRADRVVALSDHWRQELLRMAPKARVLVVENAVELPPHSARHTEAGPCRFALLARMDEWKGIDDLLDASSLLRRKGRSFELVLAGPPGTAGDAGSLAAKIQARGLGGHVYYVGPVLGDAKAELLKGVHAYVQPSHHEGMPISLLEALAHGLPVVATRVGAVPEVIHHHSEGLLVEPRRPDLLAEAMECVIESADLRERMGRSARRLAEARFSVKRFERDLTGLYTELTPPRVVASRTSRAAEDLIEVPAPIR